MTSSPQTLKQQVISPVIFGFLGTGMMVERLKKEGTSHSSSDLLKINVKMDNS